MKLAASILGWWRWVCSDEERTGSWGINGGWVSGSDGVNVEGWVRRRGRAGMVAAWAGPASTTLLGIDRARGGNLVRTSHRVGNWACGWAEVTPPGVHGLEVCDCGFVCFGLVVDWVRGFDSRLGCTEKGLRFSLKRRGKGQVEARVQKVVEAWGLLTVAVGAVSARKLVLYRKCQQSKKE
ncbi:hypothetical protein M0R45_031705 [Rubus argutus]|uniref:Uncharacterized protein n=1 Tax=Rubus argutus TaxID=59490 RepID=A0AAW1WFF8_RUBAR